MTSERSVRAALPGELDQLSTTLAAAFEDDPVFGWLMPHARTRRERLQRFFGLELRHVVAPVGCAWTCEGGFGASLELPPGKWKLPMGTQLAHGRSFLQVFGARLPWAAALITRMERRHLREPHYYMPYVGVLPSAQGQGLGTMLMRPTLERCDEEGLPAYLEATNERNAALYERLGFVHLGAFTLGGSPPLWPMRRSPAPASG